MQESVKQDREKYIGGSDIPIIMNLSPYKSRYDLLLEKAGYKASDFTGNIYTEYGNKLEPIIRDYVNSFVKGNPFIEGKHTREAEDGETIGVRIHTDGERTIKDGIEILEIKTTSQVYEDVNDYKLYLVQLLYYMAMTGAVYGLLAVYERPEDLSEELDPERLQLHGINFTDYLDLVEEIKKAVDSFIEDLEKVKANPFITEEELLPAEIPEIAERILAFESQLAYMKETEKQIKREKERLKKAMEAASVKSWKTPGGYTITLVPDGEDKTVKVFNEEKFKEDRPIVYKKYLVDKLQKGKAGYVKITAPKSKEG